MGGYMGLLLGASVLTICELIDFVINNVALRLSAKRQVRDNKEYK